MPSSDETPPTSEPRAAAIGTDSDEGEPPFRIAPPVPQPDDGRLAAAQALLDAADQQRKCPLSDEELASRQITLRQLLGLVAFAAVLLAPISHLRKDYYAGFTGLAMLLMMMISNWFNPHLAVFEFAFWISVGIYILSLAVGLTPS